MLQAESTNTKTYSIGYTTIISRFESGGIDPRNFDFGHMSLFFSCGEENILKHKFALSVVEFLGGAAYIYLVGHELSFCELRTKQVINVIDGKVLGRICDIVFSRGSAKVLGFVVPGNSGFHFFRRKGDVFVPFERICKIGVDVVLVELKPFMPGPGGPVEGFMEIGP